jgi:glycine cleavage system H lipoate-binding protein
LLNSDPYGAGWLMRVQSDPGAAGAAFLKPAEYAQFLKDSE